MELHAGELKLSLDPCTCTQRVLLYTYAKNCQDDWKILVATLAGHALHPNTTVGASYYIKTQCDQDRRTGSSQTRDERPTVKGKCVISCFWVSGSQDVASQIGGNCS